MPNHARHRQRAEQAHPHVDAEAEEHRVLERVHARVAQRRLVEDGQVPHVQVDRPQREARSAGWASTRRRLKNPMRRIGAISGPVRPSTISSAAMSPSSRCSIMCTNSRSWLALPSEVSADRDHHEARVEARLAPAGDRVAASAASVRTRRAYSSARISASGPSWMQASGDREHGHLVWRVRVRGGSPWGMRLFRGGSSGRDRPAPVRGWPVDCRWA